MNAVVGLRPTRARCEVEDLHQKSTRARCEVEDMHQKSKTRTAHQLASLTPDQLARLARMEA